MSALRAIDGGHDLLDAECRENQCPRCGFVSPPRDDFVPDSLSRPWHVRGPNAVRAYVESLGDEAQEWLLALYVDAHLHLLAVETIAKGDVGSCPVPIARILTRGYLLQAAGFILVHNHPSGDPTASASDLSATRRLSWVSRDFEVPMLGHYIVVRDGIREICWG